MGTEINRIASKRVKVSDLVVQEIRRMVESGELRQGDKLPNQNDFARELGVSRPSLREALSHLTKQGIIEQSPGVGTVLRTENPDLWVEPPPPPPLTDSMATVELTEARKAVESLVVREAVRRITDKECKTLEKTVRSMKHAMSVEDYRTYLREDVSFHFQIANASHNRYITYMFVTIRGLMEEFTQGIFEHFPELVDNSFGHHKAMLEAIQARDEERAVSEIQKHMDDIKDKLLAYYEGPGSGSKNEGGE